MSEDEKFLDFLLHKTMSPEQRRFFMWHLGDHITLYQDFNGIDFRIFLSHSDEDEHNWLFGMAFLCWSFEISWEWRLKNG